VIAALTTSPTEGSSDPVSIDPHLQFLRPLLGKTWRGELRSPDGARASTEIREFIPLDGGRVIRMTKINRELGSHGEGFLYWDDVRRVVGYFFIEDSGVFLTGEASGDERRVTLEGTMTWPSPPPRPDLKQSYDFRDTFEPLSETAMRDSWFHDAFGPWRPGHVIEFRSESSPHDP